MYGSIYDTDIYIIGSRGRGEGRNIYDIDMPIGKDPPNATRSDIDFVVQGEAVIKSRGKILDDIYDATEGAAKQYSSSGWAYPPYIKFSPYKSPYFIPR